MWSLWTLVVQHSQSPSAIITKLLYFIMHHWTWTSAYKSTVDSINNDWPCNLDQPWTTSHHSPHVTTTQPSLTIDPPNGALDSWWSTIKPWGQLCSLVSHHYPLRPWARAQPTRDPVRCWMRTCWAMRSWHVFGWLVDGTPDTAEMARFIVYTSSVGLLTKIGEF